MSIYEELINGLTNSETPLQDIFLKLKILACKLQNETLTKFVDLELNGYDDKNIPRYRWIKGMLMATVSNGYYTHKNYRLPTYHLKKYKLQNLEICKMGESIGALVEYANRQEDNLCKIIPPEFFNYFNELLEDTYCIQRIHIPISRGNIKGILTSIRSKILDLILGIEKELNVNGLEGLFNNPTKEEQNKANKIVNNFIHNTFNSYGESTQNTKIELGTDK